MTRLSTGLIASMNVLLLATAVQAQNSPIERGRALAQANCMGCHAIGPIGESRSPKPPPFRNLHQRYPVENLGEAFAEGIKVAHPMPEFRLEPGQIEDLIAYLKSLER